MQEYKSGSRNLDFAGSLKLLKYNDNLGKFDCIKTIKNKHEYIKGGFFSCGKYINFEFKSEDDWLKYSIQEAKNLNIDKIEYYYGFTIGYDSGYESFIVWDKSWKNKYEDEQ